MSAPALAASTTRAALVIHPGRRDRFACVRDVSDLVRGGSAELETRGDERDVERTIQLVEATGADVVLAAGGDGTVALVARALLRLAAEHRPDLAILPLGTANNVARSFGLPSVRTHGADAVRLALDALGSGTSEPIDVGCANGTPFVGSFAIGMDGAILARRDDLRRRLGISGDLGGYPLYLASCAIETVSHAAVHAEIELDEEQTVGPIYNLLATSRPLYAGEFRFASSDGIPEGRLALNLFGSRSAYLRSYTEAWRRHVAQERGERVDAATGTRPFGRLRVSLEREAAAQLDGEQVAARRDWKIEVIPSALRLRRPASLDR